MAKNNTCTFASLVKYIDARPYCYMRARPYYKVGKKIISYAPVPHRDHFENNFISRGDVEGWINDLPLGACIFIDTIVQEELYSTEKFEKIEGDLFCYAVKKSKYARMIDEVFPF